MRTTIPLMPGMKMFKKMMEVRAGTARTVLKAAARRTIGPVTPALNPKREIKK